MKFLVVLLIIFIQFIFIPVPKAQAYSNPATVPLLSVANFASLANTLTSSPTGPTVLNNGDLGVSSAGTCTGFPGPDCTASGNGTLVGGSIQYRNTAATTGQTDATAAVTNIGLRTPNQTITSDLTGLTLPQGVYAVGAAAYNLNGDLTLNGDANSVFIFQMSDTLITTNTARVLLTGGAQACNVFWKVPAQATFDGATVMVGTVFAGTSVDFTAGGATLAGRVIAQTAAITFRNTIVNNSSCAAAAAAALFNPLTSPEDKCPNFAGVQSTFPKGVALNDKGQCYDMAVLGAGSTSRSNSTGFPNTGSPRLPNAGIGPHENSIPWNVAIPAGIVLLVTIPFVVVLRKRTL